MTETTGRTPAPVDPARAAQTCEGEAAWWANAKSPTVGGRANAARNAADFAHAAQCVRALAWLEAHPEVTINGPDGDRDPTPGAPWYVAALGLTVATGPTPLAALLKAMEATNPANDPFAVPASYEPADPKNTERAA